MRAGSRRRTPPVPKGVASLVGTIQETPSATERPCGIVTVLGIHGGPIPIAGG